jgi:histone H3/H4
MRTKSEFPVKPVERIVKKSGVRRISKTALKALRNSMLDYAEDLARDLVAVSAHTDRNTILMKDVVLIKKLQTP